MPPKVLFFKPKTGFVVSLERNRFTSEMAADDGCQNRKIGPDSGLDLVGFGVDFLILGLDGHVLFVECFVGFILVGQCLVRTD